MDTTPYKSQDDLELEQLVDEALLLLGGQLQRETRCGKGAYGAVWLARDTITRRRVAVKVVRKDPAGAWQREYTGARHYCEHIRHVHPHLLVIHHLAECARFFCYSMEAADNAHAETDIYQPDTLGLRLRCGGPLPLESVKRYGQQLMDALQHLHAAGLVHRDLKPDNILFVNKEIKLADIGLISLIHPELSVIGTPGYIPASQARAAEPDGIAQDVYALGKVLYCLMSGCPVNQFPKMPAPVSGDKLYPPLNDTVLTACHPNPARRFQNIRGFRDAWNASPRPSRRRRAAILAAAAALAAVCAVSAARRFMGAPAPAAPAGQPAAQAAAPPEPVPGKTAFREDFAKENPALALWQISDTGERNAWMFGPHGLHWEPRANGTDALMLALQGQELPGTAHITISLTHKGASGSYAILFYDASESDEAPLDFFWHSQRIRQAHARQKDWQHVQVITEGQLSDGTADIALWKNPGHGPFNRLALLYASPPQGGGPAQAGILIHSVTIRVPQPPPRAK